MGWDSAGSIINDAAVELGLQTVGDPIASSDPNFIKLKTALKSVGRKAVKDRKWSHLRVEGSIVTVGGQEAYALPADFRNFLPDTQWDRTSRFPLGGPLSPGEWQYLKAIQSGTTYRLYARFMQGKLFIFGGAQVPAGRSVFFEYESYFWTGLQGSAIPGGNTKEFPTLSTDVVFFEPRFMVKAVKNDYAINNGMGDVFKEEMMEAFRQACNDDSNMPPLKLSPTQRDDLISTRNLPPSGYGT